MTLQTFLGIDYGMIYSPGWPNSFPADAECWYQINCPHGAPKLYINWGGVMNSIGWKANTSCGYDF